VFQIPHFIGFFLKLMSNFLLKRVFLLNADFSTAILDLIAPVPLASLLCYKNSSNIPLSPVFLFFITITGDGCLEILINLVFTLISNP